MLAFPRRHAAQIAREEVDEGANLTCQVECGAMPSPATAASRNSSPWLLRPTVATVPIVVMVAYLAAARRTGALENL